MPKKVPYWANVTMPREGVFLPGDLAAARPPSSVLPHKGGGSGVRRSARKLKSRRL
jgi:hypothetical protein